MKNLLLYGVVIASLLPAPLYAQDLAFADIPMDMSFDWDDVLFPPDLVVMSIEDAGCSVGYPCIAVTVCNLGLTGATTYVDLFLGEPAPPQIGAWGEYYECISLDPLEEKTLYFAVGEEYDGVTTWVDVLIDTDQCVEELNEDNNHAEACLTLSTCGADDEFDFIVNDPVGIFVGGSLVELNPQPEPPSISFGEQFFGLP